MHRSIVRLLVAVAVPWAVLSTALAGQTSVAKPPILVFSQPACAGDPPPQSVSMTNSAAGMVSWRLAGSPPAWLSVSPTSGAVPSTVTVSPHSAGLRPGIHQSTVTVSSTDPATPSLTIQVVLVVTPCAAPGVPGALSPPSNLLAIYEVEITFTGYSGLMEGAPNCRVNSRGFDRLYGTVSGYELNAPDEDVVYTGTLARDTNVDFCETKGRRSATDDERAWCTVSLTGNDATSVELTVSGEPGRGAYMRAASSPAGVASRHVTGQCDAQELNAIRNDYPAASDGGGGSPNGQAIDEAKARDPNGRPASFVVNGLARLRLGTYPPAVPAAGSGGWTLQVIRKVR